MSDKRWHYQVTLRNDLQGFDKTIEVESGDVWRAVDGAFDALTAKGYDPDAFSVRILERTREVGS